MRPILTAAETQALDRETEARGVGVDVLMERAGLAVARAAAALAGGAAGVRAVVLCGKGNNGGDGFVAARWLASQGAGATIVLFADPNEIREPARTKLERAAAAGVRIRDYGPADLRREIERADVAIDAMFGSGFRGAAEGHHAEAIEALNEDDIGVVAVDVPSGVEGDTGAIRGAAVWADVTVTFGAPKVGDVMLPGAARAGIVEVAELGFPPDLLRSELLLVEAEDVAELLPERRIDAHKRDAAVLVVAGSRTMAGAAGLVALGAYRLGAGLVTVAAPESVLPAVLASVPEATVLPLPEGPEGSVAGRAYEEVSGSIERFDALAIGPGLSTAGKASSFARRVVVEARLPVVADADALNAFAGRIADLAARTGETVLTPHDGELARLLGVEVDEVGADRLGRARKAAAESGATVLLKGPRTAIANPDREIRIVTTGTPVLATGGTGDVLTGGIAALAARGLDAYDAATVGAFVHGVAGRVVGERLGEGTVSSDVADALPEAVGRVLAGQP